MPTTTYHISPLQKVHDGPKAICVSCQEKKISLSAKSKKSGSVGGKLSSSRRRSRSPRLCGDCKKPIHRKSKSGLCLRCLRKQTKKNIKKKKEIKYCDCGKPLAPNNKNGVCIECWRKLPETQANRQKVQNWVNAAVFHKNATTRGSTDAP